MPDIAERSSTSLLLDIVERLATLEQSAKFADMQRQMLIQATDKLNDRLAPFHTLIASVDRLSADVEIVTATVDSHDKTLAEVRAVLRAIKWLGGFVAFVFTSAIALLALRIKGA